MIHRFSRSTARISAPVPALILLAAISLAFSSWAIEYAPDSDGDGFADWFEREQQCNPGDAASRPAAFDVNGDGRTTALDAIVMYRSMTGRMNAPCSLEKCDANRDGRVDSLDALVIYRWAIGQPDYPVLPLCAVPPPTPIPSPSPSLTPLLTASPSPSLPPTITPAPSPSIGWIDPIIVDNPQAELYGSWTLGSFSTDRYGADYRYCQTADTTSTACFRPELPAAGLYEVFEWHPQGDNRTKTAEILIHGADGEELQHVDQTTAGGAWNSLGVYNLAAGRESFVRVRHSELDGKVTMADAFKFAYLNTGPSPTPSITPTPSAPPTATPEMTATAKPFGDYVQAVMAELDQRKAADVAGYLMIDIYGKYTGVTQTLIYKGTSYMWNECAKGESVTYNGSTYQPYGYSYCSGLTLEIFHRAMEKRDAELGIPKASENWNGLGTKGIFIVKKLWNVIKIKYSDTGQYVTQDPSPATALAMSGLGRVITYGDSTKFEDVRPYDFCDISRSSGSGHSVVFINWVRSSTDNRIIGLRYYSSQGSTGGQGYNEERFDGEGGTVMKSYFHAGRVYDLPSQNTTNTIREAGYSN